MRNIAVFNRGDKKMRGFKLKTIFLFAGLLIACNLYAEEVAEEAKGFITKNEFLEYIIKGSEQWLETGLKLKKGQRFKIIASGGIYGDIRHNKSIDFGPWDPDGKNLSDINKKAPYYLQAKIDNKVIKIGKEYKGTMENDGTVILGIKDAKYTYPDNGGFFDVTIFLYDISKFKKLEKKENVPAVITISSDDSYKIFSNGKEIGKDGKWETFETYRMSISDGDILAIECHDSNKGQARMCGLYCDIYLPDYNLHLCSDDSWRYLKREYDGWNLTDFKKSTERAAFVKHVKMHEKIPDCFQNNIIWGEGGDVYFRKIISFKDFKPEFGILSDYFETITQKKKNEKENK